MSVAGIFKVRSSRYVLLVSQSSPMVLRVPDSPRVARVRDIGISVDGVCQLAGLAVAELEFPPCSSFSSYVKLLGSQSPSSK